MDVDEKPCKSSNDRVHGRIYSSNKGQPLPASVMIKGINYVMNAGKTLGDYHRLLSPVENYEASYPLGAQQNEHAKSRLESCKAVASADVQGVTYDGRSLIINGKRVILFSGSIHYPRSTPEMCPDIIANAKQGRLKSKEGM